MGHTFALDVKGNFASVLNSCDMFASEVTI